MPLSSASCAWVRPQKSWTIPSLWWRGREHSGIRQTAIAMVMASGVCMSDVNVRLRFIIPTTTTPRFFQLFQAEQGCHSIFLTVPESTFNISPLHVKATTKNKPIEFPQTVLGHSIGIKK